MNAIAYVLVFVGIVLTCPSSPTNEGALNFYPLYKGDTMDANLFTLGTWIWVYTLCALFEGIIKLDDHLGDPELSYFTYLTHYLFVALSANLILKNVSLPLWAGTTLTFISALACVFLLRMFVNKLNSHFRSSNKD